MVIPLDPPSKGEVRGVDDCGGNYSYLTNVKREINPPKPAPPFESVILI